MLVAKDENGRTPLDSACFQNYKNVVIYLLTKLGDPKIYVDMALNVDEMGRHASHTLLYRGNYDVLVTMMNYERVCLKKVIFDEL